MMIRAAKTIAEDLGGVVLTDQQEIFDDVAEQDYYLASHKTHEKITALWAEPMVRPF